jgi:CelD/BcsL family acetyltransferase involved in cellulose biosynthesis
MDNAAYEQLQPDALQKAFALMPDIDVLWFRRVRADAKLNKFLRNCGAEQLLQSAAPCSNLNLYGNFDAFLKAHWKAHRNRNRLRRRAQREGELRFEIAGSRTRAVELTRRALELKREWLRLQFRLVGTLSEPQWCDALVDAIECPAPSTEPVVTALHMQGRPAAIEVGFVRHGRYHAFLGAYDPEFGNWSPTDLLMEDTVRWCFEQSIQYYDLLPPDDPYKAKWTTDTIAVGDWMISRSLAGRLYVHCRARILRPLLLRLADGAAWIRRRWSATALGG